MAQRKSFRQLISILWSLSSNTSSKEDIDWFRREVQRWLCLHS